MKNLNQELKHLVCTSLACLKEELAAQLPCTSLARPDRCRWGAPRSGQLTRPDSSRRPNRLALHAKVNQELE